MSSHRRIVRTNSSESEIPVPKINIGSSILGFLKGTIYIVYRIIRILWYWFERIFLIVFLCVLTIGLAWWLSQKPSLYRDWDPIDATLPIVSWSGDTANISNIRDFEWKTSTGFLSRFQNGSYALSDLEAVYYIITPFSDRDGPAHTMLSFSFSGGRHLAISGEIRKERGESFSALGGILNQYELSYVVATEDDIIKLRTNYRKNQVYMYPIQVEKEKIQLLFRSMLIRADKLSREPEFYNTIWNNCTTSILNHANALRNDKLDGGKYTILPSHSDELVYSAGLINTKLSPGDARSYYRIDELARSISGEVDFSTIIRKTIK
ncbi:DUF4105 domain-containing protein [Candidatus Gracilibacteria bacterium]|nr:DUF4105 domain-containing protein [Candidatus Gracilibacteria bacterium]